MRTLITGATGFVGSRLARYLLEHGHQVSVLVRVTSRFDQLEDIVDRIGVHVVDNSPNSVQDAVAAAAPEVVFHLATDYVFDHGPDDVARMLQANVVFPLQLVDAMAREKVSCLINTGSAWQHFRDAEYDPVCLHSATKQAFQTLLAFYVNTGTIRCATLLLNDTYGPGDPRRKIFAIVREQIGKPAALKMSAGQQCLDMVHIDDIVRAYVMAAEHLRNDPSVRNVEYNVATGAPVPLRQIVETYLDLAGLQVEIDWGARPYREREVMTPWSKGRPVPGWTPEITLEQGLLSLLRE